MNDPILTAQECRAQIQVHAATIGVTETYISELVDGFYSRIRAHPVLGPIFGAHISDWEVHLPRMKSFWTSVALQAGTYAGRPVPAHMNLHEVEPAHFASWLALFRQTLEETAPSPEAVEYFMGRANRIAESLQLAMFGFPGLPVKRPSSR